jgi:hypothetical protein
MEIEGTVKLTEKQVTDIKRVLGTDKIDGITIKMFGRECKIIESPFTSTGRDTVYYAKEVKPVPEIKTGKGILHQIRLEDVRQEVLRLISEDKWVWMVRYSEIEDPDFLIDDFDEDTVKLIKEEILRRRAEKARKSDPFDTDKIRKQLEELLPTKSEPNPYTLIMGTAGKHEWDEILKTKIDEISKKIFDAEKAINPLPPLQGDASRREWFSKKWMTLRNSALRFDEFRSEAGEEREEF